MAKRQVALLGSINTGGNRIKMAELRAALEEADFANVATVTASGNVLFDAPVEAAADSAARIVAVLKQRFGIESFAIVKTREELLDVMRENPFAQSGADNVVHVHFLETQPDAAAYEQLQADHEGRGPELLAPGTGALHIDFVEGVGSSKLTGPFIAKRLGCRGTARNIRSLRRIAAAMEA